MVNIRPEPHGVCILWNIPVIQPLAREICTYNHPGSLSAFLIFRTIIRLPHIQDHYAYWTFQYSTGLGNQSSNLYIKICTMEMAVNSLNIYFNMSHFTCYIGHEYLVAIHDIPIFVTNRSTKEVYPQKVVWCSHNRGWWKLPWSAGCISLILQPGLQSGDLFISYCQDNNS